MTILKRIQAELIHCEDANITDNRVALLYLAVAEINRLRAAAVEREELVDELHQRIEGMK